MAILAATSASGGFPLLSLLVLTPAAGSVAVALVSKRRPEIAKQVAVLFAIFTGALSIAVLALFKKHGADFQLTDQMTWIKDPHISWSLGIDGISLWLVVLTGVLFPPDNPAACAASLGALLARASEWPGMRDVARAHVAAHHDWERNVHRYQDVYRALLEPSGKARVRAA